MRRFLQKLLLFLGLFLLTVPAVFALHWFVIGNQNQGSYQAAILDKLAAAKAAKGPKILLVGNSNVALGFDSDLLTELTGMETFNLGLHGGLGNAFQENMVLPVVQEGDLVVICHCDYSDDNPIPDPALAWITVEMHPELWRLLPPGGLGDMAKAYPNYFYNSLLRFVRGGKDNIPDSGTSYSRSAFNARGDVVYRGEDIFVFSDGSVPVPGITQEALDHLNELNAKVQHFGAKMVAAGYPIGLGEFTPAAEEFDAFEEELRAGLAFPVISHFRDYFLPYEMFYDTAFHLNAEGVRLRTEQLAKDLTEAGLVG